MAEKGAYLTGTIHAKPSIFEIVAQDSLSSTLEPAFKKIISLKLAVDYSHSLRCLARALCFMITNKKKQHFHGFRSSNQSLRIFQYLVLVSPHRYGWLERWSDEAYLVFNTALQYHYLKKYSASFSETFYGLKRVALLADSQTKQLSAKQEIVSILLLVLFPHLRNKISKLAERYKFDDADGRIPKKQWQIYLRKLVINGHTIFHITYECLILYRYLVYMTGRSEYSTPLLWLASVRLTYADTEKFLTITDLLNKIRTGTLNFGDAVDLGGRVFTRSLELGAFFLQFIRWWNQENYYTNLMALPTPPPPVVPKVALQYKGLCPICRKSRRIHTALPVSGYVFCYQCILGYIRDHGRCPITNYPAKEDDLVRLYVE